MKMIASDDSPTLLLVVFNDLGLYHRKPIDAKEFKDASLNCFTDILLSKATRGEHLEEGVSMSPPKGHL